MSDSPSVTTHHAAEQPILKRPLRCAEVPGLRITRAEDGRLVVSGDGGIHIPELHTVRCFPFSAKEEFLSLCDTSGRERLLIDQWQELSPEAAQAVREDLDYHEFLPTIQEIISTTAKTLPAEWTVRTDRGPIAIRIRDEDAFRTLPDGRLLITDTSGTRYVIHCREELNAASRTILRRHV